MPADFQRAVLSQVVPALRAGRVRGAGIDSLLRTKLMACLADPDADLDKPLRIDGKLEPVIKKRLAEVEHLTAGARTLVASAASLNDALAYLFRDKLFKEYLREGVQGELARRLNLAISGISALDALAPAPARGKALASSPKPSSKAVGAAQPVRAQRAGVGQAPPKSKLPKAPAAKPLPLPPGFAAYAATEFDYKYKKEDLAASIAEMLPLLANPDEQGRVAAQLSGLLGGDVPQVLVQLSRLVGEGTIPATGEVAALLRLFAARVYLQFNAIESASRLADELHADPAAYGLLSEGERLRLQNVRARCALRGGRAADAVELYRDIFAEQPHAPGALMNVVGSAFAVAPQLAHNLAKMALTNSYAVSDGDLIFIGDILGAEGDFAPAEAAFYRILQRNTAYFDAYVGLANLHLARGQKSDWRRYLRRYFQVAGDLDVTFDLEEPLAPFSVGAGDLPPITDHPRVTVVMTTFNAGETVDRAIASVLGQVLTNIELIVIDDCSEDDSRERVMEIARRDPRVKWIHNETNVGTYVSKNKGIEIATGEFVTFHDSDDWMHPRRLMRHLEAMKGGYTCTTSNWLRMDVDGHAIVRRGGPYTHLNPASTFMPRSLFERLGPFDAVRTGADAEILARIRMSFGNRSVQGLPGCLGLGLHHENSLTQSGVAAFDEFRYSPVRLAYTERWLTWQLQELAEGPKELQLHHEGGVRRFPAPKELTPDNR